MAEFVSDKRVLLSAPGNKMNNLYYTQLNSTVEQIEVEFNTGRFQQALNNAVFGGQGLVQIPNSSFVDVMYLHAELPATVADQTLPRGWLWGAVENVSFLWGSSNTPQIQMSGQSVLQTIMAQCETEERRSEMFRLGGDVILTSGIIPKADIIIPLPWSTACGLNPKKPFDSNLLRNVITVQISFKSASEIYGGTGARPNGFDVAQVVLRQGNLSNKALSLRNSLDANPTLMLAYPFIHHQSYQPPKFSASSSSDEISVVLQSFINADLVAITIGVVSDTSLALGSNNSPSPFNYEEIEDVKLLFNGQAMYDAPGALMKLDNMHSIPGGNYWHNDVIASGTTAPFTSAPVDTYIYMFNFSRIRAICFENEFQNTRRIGNQVLELRFKLPNNTGAENYTLYSTYHYNSICEVSQGMTNIFIN